LFVSSSLIFWLNERVKTFSAFVISVSRHWLLLFAGPAVSVALGGIEHYSGRSVSFREYAILSIVSIFAAVFRAWRDEYLARLATEATGETVRPAVVISLGEMNKSSVNKAPFTLKNVGATPAFNIRFLDAELGDRALEVEETAEIAAAESATPQAFIRGAGIFWARDFVQFLERGFEAVGREQWPVPEDGVEDSSVTKERFAAMFGLGELVLPLIMKYRDLAGLEYVTQQDLVFEPIVERVSIRLVYSGRALNAPLPRNPYIVPGARKERKSRQSQ
jgi:hypothetical protein